MATKLSKRVAAILADRALDLTTDSRQSSRVEEVEKLIPDVGWHAIEAEMLAVLLESEQADLWSVAAGVLWGAALDERPLQGDRVIAHLCHRLPITDNLVWSITSKLKDVEYLSDYDPLQDPAVIHEIKALRAARCH